MAEATPPEDHPGPAQSTSDARSTLNAQIADAVKQATDFAFGAAGEPQPATGRSSAGAALAYDQVAQTCALAIQDAADYERNVMSVATAAQGKALALMLSDPANIERYSVVYTLALSGPVAAAVTAGVVGAQINETLKSFPRQ